MAQFILVNPSTVYLTSIPVERLWYCVGLPPMIAIGVTWVSLLLRLYTRLRIVKIVGWEDGVMLFTVVREFSQDAASAYREGDSSCLPSKNRLVAFGSLTIISCAHIHI